MKSRRLSRGPPWLQYYGWVVSVGLVGRKRRQSLSIVLDYGIFCLCPLDTLCLSSESPTRERECCMFSSDFISTNRKRLKYILERAAQKLSLTKLCTKALEKIELRLLHSIEQHTAIAKNVVCLQSI